MPTPTVAMRPARDPAFRRSPWGWIVGAWLAVSGCDATYVVPAEGCAGPLEQCEGACIDPREDPENCGACGVTCSARQECAAGACVEPCSRGDRCGVECVDVMVSRQHCGACNDPCVRGQECRDGACVSDACAGRCDPLTEVCDGDACLCRPGMIRCGDRCVDPQLDPAHCGGCDIPCEVCRAGACGTDCEGFPSRCVDSCTDTSRDPSNCGECGMRCAADSICVDGTCWLSQPSRCTACPCGFCSLGERTCVDPAPYGDPMCL